MSFELRLLQSQLPIYELKGRDPPDVDVSDRWAVDICADPTNDYETGLLAIPA
jgi:hypothetical protein